MPSRSTLRLAHERAPARALPAAGFQDKDKSGLQPPKCSHCNLSMTWYRSELVQRDGRRAMRSFFHCANCGRIAEGEMKPLPDA